MLHRTTTSLSQDVVTAWAQYWCTSIPWTGSLSAAAAAVLAALPAALGSERKRSQRRTAKSQRRSHRMTTLCQLTTCSVCDSQTTILWLHVRLTSYELYVIFGAAFKELLSLSTIILMRKKLYIIFFIVITT